MFWPYYDNQGFWGYTLMFLSMLLFWGLLAAGVFFLVRYVGRAGASGPAGPAGRPSAEHILAERYARGEIDEEEYRNRLSVLRGRD